MSLREALISGAQIMEKSRPHYEPIVVSPAEMNDPVFMEWLRLNYPNGRKVWRVHCDGCSLCEARA